MTNGGPHTTSVTVLYDPLCGWCYGATPALRCLHADSGVRLELAPTGLFSGDGARTMDAGLAEYAWANDQRIEQLSEQRFSKRYRDHVLGATGTRLDSGLATMALTAAALSGPSRELDALEAIQTARYVEGRDVTALGVLVDILRKLGLDAAATRLSGADSELVAEVESRTSTARRVLRAVGGRGVPTVVVGESPSQRLVASDYLYGPFDVLLRQLRAV
ncbi:MAG: DsbA family protein [Polyangiaceae bacterium]